MIFPFKDDGDNNWGYMQFSQLHHRIWRRLSPSCCRSAPFAPRSFRWKDLDYWAAPCDDLESNWKWNYMASILCQRLWYHSKNSAFYKTKNLKSCAVSGAKEIRRQHIDLDASLTVLVTSVLGNRGGTKLTRTEPLCYTVRTKSSPYLIWWAGYDAPGVRLLLVLQSKWSTNPRQFKGIPRI